MANGYQKTALSSISKKLGITKPALYYYYPSKKELFLACIETFFIQVNNRALDFQSDATTTKGKIKDMLKNFSQPAVFLKPEWQVDDFYYLYFVVDAIKNIPEVSQLYTEACNKSLDQLKIVIEEGIQNGELKKDMDIEALLTEIGVLIEGFAITNYMGYFKDDSDIFERVFELVWNGVK